MYMDLNVSTYYKLAARMYSAAEKMRSDRTSIKESLICRVYIAKAAMLTELWNDEHGVRYSNSNLSNTEYLHSVASRGMLESWAGHVTGIGNRINQWQD